MTTTTPSYTIDDKQTVSGQLTGLLEQDNPYMKQAKAQGEQFANRRGMLNSSIGAQASQDASIQAAMPIAQADAAAHNQFASQQYGAELQHGLLDKEQEFSAEQNQNKFDQDWRMQQAEGSTEREVEALKQQAGLYAQFTKGVADINSTDMTQEEKSTAVSSLWTQFQKGSAIADTLRYISINDDGTVYRDTAGAAAAAAAAGNGDTFENNYVSGTTTDTDGNLIDQNGYKKPTTQAPQIGLDGYDYNLANGAWVKYTIPKLPELPDPYQNEDFGA